MPLPAVVIAGGTAVAKGIGGKIASSIGQCLLEDGSTLLFSKGRTFVKI